jgi:hypothetical protein
MTTTMADTAIAEDGLPRPEQASQSAKWPPRACEERWWQTQQDRDALVERLLRLFVKAPSIARDQARRRGMVKMLDWLERQPGDTWQDRWLASDADTAGFDWADLPLKGIAAPRGYPRDELNCGMTMLVAGQAIRPGYRWLLRQRQVLMLAEARAAIDPDGFDQIEQHASQAVRYAKSDALNKLT